MMGSIKLFLISFFTGIGVGGLMQYIKRTVDTKSFAVMSFLVLTLLGSSIIIISSTYGKNLTEGINQTMSLPIFIGGFFGGLFGSKMMKFYS